MGEARLVDPVADARRDVHADLDAVCLERLRRALRQHGRQHLVAVAMHQQHRWLRPDLGLERLGAGQRADHVAQHVAEESHVAPQKFVVDHGVDSAGGQVGAQAHGLAQHRSSKSRANPRPPQAP